MDRNPVIDLDFDHGTSKWNFHMGVTAGRAQLTAALRCGWNAAAGSRWEVGTSVEHSRPGCDGEQASRLFN